MKFFKYIILSISLLVTSQALFAQGGYEDLLLKEVEVDNPVYMPIIGIGAGYINYYGELQNDFKNLIQGQPSFRLNVFQYVDQKHHMKINLNAMYGTMSGYERNYTDSAKNTNFETQMLSIGLNYEYSFGNIFKSDKKILPFVSLGFEYITSIKTKTDIKSIDRFGNEVRYTYNDDGTIRLGDQIVTRDYDYETTLSLDNPYGIGPDDRYDEATIAFVLDAGLDFKISNRASLRLASSLHYTLTDDIDGVTPKNTIRVGETGNDMFSLTYLSLNIDLFSSGETKMQELLFLDVSGDFDYTVIADTDRDGVTDLIDDCNDTPKGVAVDSVGCPHDDDKDGVPNYRDKEQFSEKGAIVDEFGAELSPNKIRATLYQDLDAVNRDELYMMPIGMGASQYEDMTNVEIPQKYKKLDKDGDNYISFDELLDAISGFFDFDSEYSTEDIYDLNNFFFAQ